MPRQDHVYQCRVGFGFCNEDLGNVWEGFYEVFSGFVLAKVVVEGLTSDDKALDLVPNQFTITGHFGGKVLIRLDLNDTFNRLDGPHDFTIVGDIISIVLQH